ncbi:MAG: alpha/beta fold hydrolase [Pseudomonadales bacterium]|jgi:pimeloyl-ACP methyl ester carboxylesterase|nr:alpha/beta fold hydrolase [Pseudomonadales bacterium]
MADRRSGLLALLATLATGCGGALPGLALDGPAAPNAALAPIQCESSRGRLHSVHTGAERLPAVLFLHGTPGRWRAFERYLADPELAGRLHLVAVDRLGWGRSTLPGAAHSVEPSFAVHSEVIGVLLDDLAARNGGLGTIVVGHSLGASLAPRLAADHGSAVSGLLLLAGSHDPERRARRWYNLAAELPPVRWLIGEDLRRSNDEIMALPEQLRSHAERWPTLGVPITVIQGMEDTLVSPGHADFVEALAPDARVLRLAEADHFVPWNRYEVVKAELLALADSVNGTRPMAQPAAAPGACSFGQSQG